MSSKICSNGADLPEETAVNLLMAVILRVRFCRKVANQGNMAGIPSGKQPLRMKHIPPPRNDPKDSPAARKRRLKQRLREMSERNDREMSALMKSIERVKATFRPKKPGKPGVEREH